MSDVSYPTRKHLVLGDLLIAISRLFRDDEITAAFYIKTALERFENNTSPTTETVYIKKPKEEKLDDG